MGASLLITLREGLEIALILAILLAYLRRTDRSALQRPVWVGTAVAAAVCIVAGVVFSRVVGDFEGKTEQAVEAALALSAAALLTWMVFWMRRHARGLATALEKRTEAAASRSGTAVALVAFFAVVREGFETVLFLLGAEVNAASGGAVVAGGLAGLALAAGLGYLVYQGGNRVNVRRFFQLTGILLTLFAAGLVGKGLHELRELIGIEGFLAGTAWTVRTGLLAHGWVRDFLEALFGWTPAPDRARVLGYALYLVPVAWLSVVWPRRSATAPPA